MKEKLKVLGQQIKIFRTANNIRQEDLARMVNITPQYLSHLENGHKEPSLSLLNKIGERLNLDLQIYFHI